MPRKPKIEKKTITVPLDGVPVSVILHPPSDLRKSWYVYWNGLVTSKSTGQASFEEAVVAAEEMLRGWKTGASGDRPRPTDAILTDDEFKEIQRTHFNRKKDPSARKRSEKSLIGCLEAIDAFREISGVRAVTAATPDDCASFQRKALTYAKNWRQKYPNSKEQVETVSVNTVLKWTRSLQAAFNRANRNAGKKCVRGVVDERKLLTGNPWNQFNWVEGIARPIRQFDDEELASLLDYLAGRWTSVLVAPAIAKTLLWSCCRREEVMSLTWDALRAVGNEYHFEVVGKWGVKKWFRIPAALQDELLAFKTVSPYVFAAYTHQLQQHHAAGPRPAFANKVDCEFKPVALGDWFYERVVAWSKTLPGGKAYIHIFRKTALQYARAGEDVNREVAEDAQVSQGVMEKHYVTQTDEQLRQKSNRTYKRLTASLPADVALRYGYIAVQANPLQEQLKAATAAQDWQTVVLLAAKLEKQQHASKV